MEYSQEQLECIKEVCALYRSGKPLITIAGAAGTGKTTIVKEIIRQLKIKMDNVSFVTYTGKASQVLTRKGTMATTIHQTIYHSKKKKNKDGSFTFTCTLMNELEKYTELFVVDEISMVGTKLLKDLMSFGVPIIALGDPNQLPPVNDDKTDILDNPDFTLTQIFRQEDGNTIIDFSQQILKERLASPKVSDDFIKKVKTEELSLDMLNWADQVLCCKRSTKDYLNKLMREARQHYGDVPCLGDKMICTSNRWSVYDNMGRQPLLNGTTGYITKVGKVVRDEFKNYVFVDFTVDYDETLVYSVKLDLNPILGLAPQSYKAGTTPPKLIPCEFDFGYAITVHKSQGSEWDKVLVYSTDAFGYDKRKLLYTAATRASKKLVWVG